MPRKATIFQRAMRFRPFVCCLLTLAIGLTAAGHAAETAAPAPAKSLASLLGPILQQARYKKVRGLMGGTSISAGASSNNQLVIRQLKAVYGDARTEVNAMGVLGGSFELPVEGWYKQPFSGPLLLRLRGNRASLPLPIIGYASKIVVEYSKEADGGGCYILVDGKLKGAINCKGTQRYGLKTTLTVPEGLHTVTFLPPRSGSIYLERVLFEQNRPGIDFIDGTLGGSNLDHVYHNYPRGGQTVPGIPTRPGVGVSAFFRRADVDFVIWSGAANDSGGPDDPVWTARMNEMVNATRGRCPLILIAEMGGHLAMPADSRNAGFLAKYNYLRKLGNDNAHVFTLDWHGASFDPDIKRYAANYYYDVVVNPATGDYTGDFIHPNSAAHRIASEMLCKSLGIPTPLEILGQDVDNRVWKTAPVPAGTSIAFTDGTTPRTGTTTAFGAAAYGGLTYMATLPLVFSTATVNLAPEFNQRIAASPLSDKFGKYLDFDNNSQIALFAAIGFGERVTVTALMKPRTAGTGAQFHPEPGTMYFGSSLLPDTVERFDSAEECPGWMTFDYVKGIYQDIGLIGRLYSISVTHTHGQPVSTERPVFHLPATLSTLDATIFGPSAVQLHASVNPKNDGEIGVYFQYSSNPTLEGAASTLNNIVPNGNAAYRVDRTVNQLRPATKYYFRAMLTTAGNPEPTPGNILSLVTPGGTPPAAAPEIVVGRGQVAYDRNTLRYVQLIALSNRSGAAIPGPFYLVIDGLNAKVTLPDANGTSTSVAPLGSPFITVVGAGASLPPGATFFKLHFADPSRAPISYSTRVLRGGTLTP